MNNPFAQTTYLLSAAKIEQLPADEGFEVAFAGRSNVGKSSAINSITNIKSLAKTSKTPGRTQTLNFFEIDPQHRLVDLPGYGYAKVSKTMKKDWQQTLNRYLIERQSLQGLIVLIDIRHPLKDHDHQLLAWSAQNHLATHVLLTKADKLSRGKALVTLNQVTQMLQKECLSSSCQLFSSTQKIGIEGARHKLNEWLHFDNE